MWVAKRQNVNKMMAQVQQMQEQMRVAQEELANKKLGGVTGGLGDLGLNLPGM